MTKKDYELIADVLAKKHKTVLGWNNLQAISLSLAYIEDFLEVLKQDNPRFNRKKFLDRINSGMNVTCFDCGKEYSSVKAIKNSPNCFTKRQHDNA